MLDPSRRELRARFAREAKITGGLESEHIVQVSDAGIDEPTARFLQGVAWETVSDYFKP